MWRTRSYLLLLVVITCAILHVCSAFNFEPRLPVVKRGVPGSYFGYSVAEHLILDENKRRVVEAVYVFSAKSPAERLR